MNKFIKLVDVLLESPLNQLKILDMRYTDVEEVKLKRFFQKQLPLLRFLLLSSCRIGKGILEIILTKLNRLDFLFIHDNGLNMSTLNFPLTMQPPNLNLLNTLQFCYEKLGLRGAQYLVKGNLPLLEKFGLRNCSLTDEAIKHFGKGQWPQMTKFYMEENQGISPQCLFHFPEFIWPLTELILPFSNCCWSIHYFSATLRQQSNKKQLKISKQFSKSSAFRLQISKTLKEVNVHIK